MEKHTEKPSPEAKALSLFFMAYKTETPVYKDKSKRINRLWDLVKKGELPKEDYLQEIETMINMYGGYDVVVEKTVEYYLNKTGQWKSQGDDQYSQDANKVAARIMKLKKK